MRTGDLGYYDEEGYIYVIDRMKEILKVQGHHLSPVVLEEHLSKHPGVFQVAVVGVPHLIDYDHAVAFVCRKRGCEVLVWL